MNTQKFWTYIYEETQSLNLDIDNVSELGHGVPMSKLRDLLHMVLDHPDDEIREISKRVLIDAEALCEWKVSEDGAKFKICTVGLVALVMGGVMTQRDQENGTPWHLGFSDDGAGRAQAAVFKTIRFKDYKIRETAIHRILRILVSNPFIMPIDKQIILAILTRGQA